MYGCTPSCWACPEGKSKVQHPPCPDCNRLVVISMLQGKALKRRRHSNLGGRCLLIVDSCLHTQVLCSPGGGGIHPASFLACTLAKLFCEKVLPCLRPSRSPP